jgi:hypothetical protein
VIIAAVVKLADKTVAKIDEVVLDVGCRGQS